jgi:hypothetical protein
MPSCVKGWLDKDMTWLAPPDGSPGRPAVFSDAAIQFCLTIKVLFKLPLRQKTLAVQIPYRRTDGPLNLLVDSTGTKFLGDGALSGDCFAIPCRVTNGRRASTVFRDAASRCPLLGHARMPCQATGNGLPANRERGRKVHLAMDTATSDIRAVKFTPSSDGDSPVLPDLLDQIPEGEEIGTVTAPSYGLQANRCPAVHACMHERDQPPSHRDHPDPQERTALEGRLPSRNRQKRDPTSHSPLWPGILDALDRIPRP